MHTMFFRFQVYIHRNNVHSYGRCGANYIVITFLSTTAKPDKFGGKDFYLKIKKIRVGPFLHHQATLSDSHAQA